MKKLVVFDLDGTLVDSTQDLATAVNATLDEIAPGTQALPTDVVRSLVGNGARNLVEQSLLRAGLARPVDAVLARFLAHYRGCLLDTTRLYPGVAEGLEAVAARPGVSLAVLSNKPGELCRAILAGLGVAHHFARIAGGGDLPGRKPDPAVLLRLIAELGFRPDEALMVGDSPVDVRTARAAGVAVLGVAWGLDPGSLKGAPPDRILNALNELAELC